jgi:hypothetical protein
VRLRCSALALQSYVSENFFLSPLKLEHGARHLGDLGFLKDKLLVCCFARSTLVGIRSWGIRFTSVLAKWCTREGEERIVKQLSKKGLVLAFFSHNFLLIRCPLVALFC